MKIVKLAFAIRCCLISSLLSCLRLIISSVQYHNTSCSVSLSQSFSLALRLLLRDDLLLAFLGCWGGGIRVFVNQSFCATPQRHDASLGRLCSFASLRWNLILLVSFCEEGTSLVKGFGCKLLGILCGRWLSEVQFFGWCAQHASVVEGCWRIVLFGDCLALFSVIAKELKEALITSVLHAIELEIVPGVFE